MKNLIKFLTIITSSLIICISFSCSKNSGQSPKKIVMTYVTAPLNVPSIIDRKENIYVNAFKKIGINLDYSTITSGSDQTAALASGDIHILNAIGGTSVILAAANGNDIGIISMYSVAPKAFTMYSKNPDIHTPDDLKGLKIGGPKGTNLHELLVAYLSTSNLTVNDVEFISMSIPSAVAALENGSIDVALAGGEASYNCEQSGYNKICDGENLISAVICTACSKKFANQHPEIIKEFKRTQNEIVNLINEDPEKALSITSKSLDSDINTIKNMYYLYDFSTEFTPEKINLLQQTENFLYTSGLTDARINIKDLILQ